MEIQHVKDVEFCCPKCDKELRACPDDAGMKIRCPACEEWLRVPALRDVSATPPDLAPPAPVGGHSTRDPTGPPRLKVFTIKDHKKSRDTWELTITSDMVRLKNAAGTKMVDIPYAEHFKYFDLLENPGDCWLIVKQGFRGIIIIPAEILYRLEMWRGPTTEEWIVNDLKGRYANFIIGAVFLAPSLFTLLNSLLRQRPMPLAGWSGILLGLPLIIIGILSWCKPTRWLLFVEAGWWLVNGLLTGWLMYMTKVDGWGIFFCILCFVFVCLRGNEFTKHSGRQKYSNRGGFA